MLNPSWRKQAAARAGSNLRALHQADVAVLMANLANGFASGKHRCRDPSCGNRDLATRSKTGDTATKSEASAFVSREAASTHWSLQDSGEGTAGALLRSAPKGPLVKAMLSSARNLETIF